MEAISIKNETLVRRSISVIGLCFTLAVLALSLWVPLIEAVANHFLKGIAQVNVQSLSYQDKKLFLDEIWVKLPSDLQLDAKKVTVEIDIQQIIDGRYGAKTIGIDGLSTHGLADNITIKRTGATNVILGDDNALMLEKLFVTGFKQQDIKANELIGRQFRYHQDDLSLDTLKIEKATIESPIELVAPSLEVNKAVIKSLSESSKTAYSIESIKTKDLLSDVLGASVKTASISGAKGDTSSARIDKLLVSNVNIGLKRDQHHQWQGLPLGGEATGEKDFSWAISKIVLQDSRVDIEDNAITPGFTDELLLEKLEVKNLSSEMADAKAQLSAMLGKYTPISLEVGLRDQQGALHVEARGEVNGLVLKDIDGYISNDLGHNFERGQLSDSFSLAIKNKRMTMSNELEVRDLEAIAIEGKQGPPLGLAVTLLQDKDGILRLSVPIEGDLDNPEFKIAQALTPVITKAVTLAAATNIQPLGTVLLVKGLLDKTLLKVSFEPALFEAGKTALAKGQIDNMSELAKKLIITPNLQVRLCGVVTPADKAESEEAFKKLGEARAEVIKARLMAGGLPVKQLVSCPPFRDDAEAAKPRVDITL